MKKISKNLSYIARLIGYKKNELFIGPETVIVSLTRVCNYKCLSCFAHSPLLNVEKNKSDYLPFDQTKRLLRDAKKIGAEKIIISGAGDPSTHPNFYEICKLISNFGFFCEFNSNLALVECEKFSNFLPDRIKVNFSAASKEVYNHFHQIDDCNIFEDVIKKIEYFLERDVKVTLVFVLCGTNIHELIGMVKLAVSLQKHGRNLEIRFKPAILFNGTEAVEVTDDQIKKIISEIPLAQKILDKLRIPNNLNMLKQFYFGKSKGGEILNCYAGWFISFITERGNVYSCCSRVSSFGNIKNQSFQDIWANKDYWKFRLFSRAIRYRDRPLNAKYHRCLNYDKNYSISRSRTWKIIKQIYAG
jgi:MoaA/NifB/PqqE/SkfB family radical SAM enzyme